MTKQLKVLIVDDDQDLLYLLKKKLYKSDIACVTATQPSEGLDKANNQNPDLVLLDLNLPKMSGLGFLREFKHRPKLSDIPIVVLTSLADEEVCQEAMNLGAAAYLTKDCSDNELLTVIDRFANH